MGSPLTGGDTVVSGGCFLLLTFVAIGRLSSAAAPGTSTRRAYARPCSSHLRRSLAVNRTLAGMIVFLMAGPALAQVEKLKSKPRPERLAPTAADVAYGEHPR